MAESPGCHLRHAEAVGEWTAGFQLFLRFAVERKAIPREQAEFYAQRVRDGLVGTLSMQAEIQDEADPGEIFIDMLRSLLS